MNRYVSFTMALIALCCLTLVSAHSVAQNIIRYPQSVQINSKQNSYPLSLLKLAISKIELDYRLEPSTLHMNQGRALKQLAAGIDIEVLWTMSSEAREKALYAIRIPIFKGLIGWRVFLIHADINVDLTKPIPLEKAKQLNLLQEHDWPDTAILRHNQFNVKTAPNYEGLFKMLQYQRVDLFPRSIIEVWDELKVYADLNLTLEKHTLISYPSATYFFVSKENIELAKIISQGLEEAMEDGSFDALFKLHFSKIIKKSKLNTRTHYRLENPLLTKETPLENKRLWFSLN